MDISDLGGSLRFLFDVLSAAETFDKQAGGRCFCNSSFYDLFIFHLVFHWLFRFSLSQFFFFPVPEFAIFALFGLSPMGHIVG